MNITERKRIEAVLRQKGEELTETQRLAGVGSWQWDTRIDRVTWSEELRRLVAMIPSCGRPSSGTTGRSPDNTRDTISPFTTSTFWPAMKYPRGQDGISDAGRGAL
jgi:hypothetical protein